jgi:hypothetical protein
MSISKRKKIFDYYSSNFDTLAKNQGWEVGTFQDGKFMERAISCYVCPLCYQVFGENELDQGVTNPLTIEHVPPKPLGGKPILLTCKNCNNKSGHLLDHHISTSLKTQDFTEGFPSSKIESKISIQEANPFRTEVTYDSEKRLFNFTFNGNNPYAKNQIENLSKMKEWKFNFNFKRASTRIFNLGLLRIAHLLAFKRFGHAYLFNSGARLIKEQLKAPREEILNPIVSSGYMWKEFDGTYLINKPKDFNSLLTVFTLNSPGSKRYFAVILPGPRQCDIEYYKSANKDKFTINFSDIIDFDIVQEPLAYLKIIRKL